MGTTPAKTRSARAIAKGGGSSATDKIATVTVAQLQSSFKLIEAKLSKGVRVQVTRRGQIVAEVRAPRRQDVGRPFEEKMPDFMTRLKEIWGDKPLGLDTTALVSEGRDRDLLS